MTLLPSETRASIRTALARALGALVMSGTVTAYTDTTNITCSEAIFNQDDALIGYQIVFKSGTGAVANNERWIDDFVASSDTISVARAWETNPVANDTFDIYNPVVADKALLDLAIDDAILRVQDTFMLEWEDIVSLVTDSCMANGGFEDWANGASSAPDKWAVDTNSTITRNSTLDYIHRGRYSAKLVSDGTNLGYLEQKNDDFLHPWEDLAGRTLTLSMWVYCTTASRCGCSLYDGTTTTTDTHDGGGWDLITCSAEMASAATEITAKLTISAGSAVTAYLSEAWLEVSGLSLQEYYLPTSFSRLSKVLLETSDDYQFGQAIPNRYWYADPSRERLVFKRDLYTPSSGYRLKLIGQRYQQVPDSDDDAIIIPASYIISQARAFILQLRDPQNAPQAAADALRLRRQAHRQPRANSRYVR